LSHGKSFYRADYGVTLESIQVRGTPKSAKELVPQLRFIENKEYCGTYFQGGVRQVSEHDYRVIIEGVSISGLGQILRYMGWVRENLTREGL
jgi:hypothetical protein